MKLDIWSDSYVTVFFVVIGSIAYLIFTINYTENLSVWHVMR